MNSCHAWIGSDVWLKGWKFRKQLTDYHLAKKPLLQGVRKKIKHWPCQFLVIQKRVALYRNFFQPLYIFMHHCLINSKNLDEPFSAKCQFQNRK
jgi:hypothetical protein